MSEPLDGYLVLHAGPPPPFPLAVQVVLNCTARGPGEGGKRPGPGAGGRQQGQQPGQQPGAAAPASSAGGVGFTQGAPNDADAAAKRPGKRHTVSPVVHQLTLVYPPARGKSAPPSASASSAAASNSSTSSTSSSAGPSASNSLTMSALLHASSILDSVRQRRDAHVLVTSTEGPALPYLVGAAHLLLRTGPRRPITVAEAARRAAAALQCEPPLDSERLLEDVAASTQWLAPAAAFRFNTTGAGAAKSAAAAAALSSAVAAVDAAAPRTGSAPQLLRQLIADINATCPGKPYHSLPLLPVDGETGAPCGFADTAKGLWYSRSLLAQRFVTFLTGKGYDADALLALAYRMMPRVGAAPRREPAVAGGADAGWAVECLFGRYTVLAHVAGLALEPPMEKALPNESPEDTAARCCREESGVSNCTEFVRLGGILGRDGRVNVVVAPQSAAWRAKFCGGGGVEGVGGAGAAAVGGGGGGSSSSSSSSGSGSASASARGRTTSSAQVDGRSGGGGGGGSGDGGGASKKSDGGKLDDVDGRCFNPHGLPALWLCVPELGLRAPAQKAVMECCALGMRTMDQLRRQAGHPFCYMVESFSAVAGGDFSADNLVPPEELPNYAHNGVTLYFADAEGRIATQRSDRLRKMI